MLTVWISHGESPGQSVRGLGWIGIAAAKSVKMSLYLVLVSRE